jgi:hypothetical protein
MQKLLLQGMTRQESTVKGLVFKWLGRNETSQGGIRAECEVADVDLAKEKRDMIQALHTIWNGRKKWYVQYIKSLIVTRLALVVR